MRHIARVDTWFDEGTEAELLVDCRPQFNFGLFRGLKNGKPDEEECQFDEFYVVDDTPNEAPNNA